MQKRRRIASTKWLKVMLSILIGLEVVLGVLASPKTVRANLLDAQYLGRSVYFLTRTVPKGGYTVQGKC